MKPTELKNGTVILHEGKTYLVFDMNRSVDWGNEEWTFEVEGKRIKCPDCMGNLQKRGKIKNQYSCMACNKLVFLDD